MVRYNASDYPILRKVILNNKTRKGQYIYVKLGKNIRGKYYKIRSGLNLDDYLTIAEDRIRYKKGGVKAAVQEPAYFEKKLKRSKTIDSLIKSGVFNVRIKDISNSRLAHRRNRIKELMSNVIKDKSILKIMSQESNMKKIRKRFGYEVIIYGDTGHVLAEVSHFGKKTPEQVYKDVRKIFRKGTDVYAGEKFNKVKQLGYKAQFRNKGRIGRIDLLVTYRKG